MKKRAILFLLAAFFLYACSNRPYNSEQLSPEPEIPYAAALPVPNQESSESPIERILLASIPERDIYAYGHVTEGDGFVVNIQLEVGDRVSKQLYTRYLARSDFRLYYGSFFDEYEYHLVFTDREHGGHGGGSETMMVFCGNTFDIIPIRWLWLSNRRDDYKISDNGYVIVSIDEWQFEIPLEQLTETYRHGNRFAIENNRLVEYFFYDISMSGANHGMRYMLLFKAEYILEGGEISVGTLSFVYDKGYYSEHPLEP